MNKLLSIIIPAYNAGKYIEECLNSLKHLMNDSFEVLVLDDGSTDNTAEIVTRCSANDNRIRLFTQDNGGVSKARNKGLDEACGKYVMFLDADDYLIRESFNKVMEIINADRYDFVAFARNIVESNGRIWKEEFPFNGDFTDDKAISDKLMYANSLFNECWGKLYRKSIIDRYSIRFPEGIPIGEDLMFVMEYYSHCHSYCVLNVSLVAYRQHGDSAMRKYSITDRIRYTEHLYNYARKFNVDTLNEQIAFYYFKVLTNLCREYEKSTIVKENIEVIYNSKMAKDVLSNLNICKIPFFRIHEYLFMTMKMNYISAVYYHFKGLKR
ncbi:glycosyltransferase family 2 protein [Butyrivibrio sp. JL13D10]|uniref:glycosyltransferase family 2 protein n=1 Tax=Butyrivibrio sp. JL13D10 TaxID=3236815 RepID=UPI0038B45663